MNSNTYETLFRKEALKAGFSEANIVKCISYASPLLDKGLPVIYNIHHLGALVGYRPLYIARAVEHTPFFYRRFYITKANGKKRLIEEPLPSLKEIQIWILKNILYKLPVSRFAKAYIPKVSILQNVKYHKGQELVLSLDIQDFFPSFKKERVQSFFVQLGYSPSVANLLGKLCINNGCLPQGAPTSPYLSNLLMFDFDKAVEKYCIDNKIRYTRYSDDLTFSGEFDAKELEDFVKKILTKDNLVLNEKKTVLMRRGQRQVVTGIVVNDKLQIPKERRRQLRQIVYFIEKFGLEAHSQHIGNQRHNYLQHVIGMVDYALFVNPNDTTMAKYKVQLQRIKELMSLPPANGE